MSIIRYKVTPRDHTMADMICHNVYEFLMSILIINTILVRAKAGDLTRALIPPVRNLNINVIPGVGHLTTFLKSYTKQ
jgi:hypothetical protein